MISVVIPSYNQAEYLPKAIESVLEQNAYAEIFVIDDGSNDNSLEIAKRYGPAVNVISQVNKGLASARNTGIMNVHGEFCLFLDADDILLNNCVARITQVAKET